MRAVLVGSGAAALVGLAALAGCHPAVRPQTAPPTVPVTDVRPTPLAPLHPDTPTSSGTATGSPTVATAPSGPPPTLVAARPAYRGLVAGWQRARSTFVGTVSAGRPLTLAAEHAAAASYLRAVIDFAAGITSLRWPPAAGGQVADLSAVTDADRTALVAMTQAPDPSAFTEWLGEYGLGVARENRAVAAADRALSGG